MIDAPGRSPLGVCYRSPLGVRGSENIFYNIYYSQYLYSTLYFTYYWLYVWPGTSEDPRIPPDGWWLQTNNTVDWRWGTRQVKYVWRLHKNQRGIVFHDWRLSSHDVAIVTPTVLTIEEPTPAPEEDGACLVEPRETGVYTCPDGGFCLHYDDDGWNPGPGYYMYESWPDFTNLQRKTQVVFGEVVDTFDPIVFHGPYFENHNVFSGLALGEDITLESVITLEELNAMGFNAVPGEYFTMYVTFIPDGCGFLRYRVKDVTWEDPEEAGGAEEPTIQVL